MNEKCIFKYPRMSTRLIAMSQSLGIEFTTSELTEKKKETRLFNYLLGYGISRVKPALRVRCTQRAQCSYMPCVLFVLVLLMCPIMYVSI